jgi:hypothetical protein
MYGSAGAMLASHGFLVRRAGGQVGRRCTLPRDEKGWSLPADQRARGVP